MVLEKIDTIFVDLDGTLLNREGNVSSFVLESIDKAAECGIQTIICTGRPYASAKRYHDLLKKRAPMILNNGATAISEDGKVLWESYLASDTVKEVVLFLEKEGFHYQLYDRESILVKRHSYMENRILRWNEKLEDQEKILVVSLEEAKDFFQRDHFFKILVVEEQEERRLYLENFLKKHNLNTMRSQSNYIDIMAAGISKGSGVKKIKEIRKIQRIMTIGDQQNDISMFLEADLAVAMQNAHPQLKELAHWIVPSHQHDGVGYGILRYLDGNK